MNRAHFLGADKSLDIIELSLLLLTFSGPFVLNTMKKQMWKALADTDINWARILLAILVKFRKIRVITHHRPLIW